MKTMMRQVRNIIWVILSGEETIHDGWMVRPARDPRHQVTCPNVRHPPRGRKTRVSRTGKRPLRETKYPSADVRRSVVSVYGGILAPKPGKGTTEGRDARKEGRREALMYISDFAPRTLQWTLSLTLVKCTSSLPFSSNSSSRTPRCAVPILPSFHINLHLLAAKEENPSWLHPSVASRARVVTMTQAWRFSGICSGNTI